MNSVLVKVRIFTFAVGPPAESTEALRKMACNNKGGHYFGKIMSFFKIYFLGCYNSHRIMVM